ncbi:MAG: hypothetical protein HOI53_09520 [Francisellaceae bacterium]|nr:hypothetical protein [Francisellaceae bacterium]
MPMPSTLNIDLKHLRETLDKKTGKKRPYYNQFTDENGHVWEYTGILPGRGQDGMAAFYRDQNGTEILVKVDDAATCALEGTAYFARNAKGVVPAALKNSAIFATAGRMVVEGKDSVVSIQPKVAGNFESWDEVVYGEKRDPSAWWSWESTKSDMIISGIESLSQNAQWQLAAGIKLSAVCGDESLHVGQFLALKGSDGEIIGIQRIDFGARERYSRSRNSHPESEITPFNNSHEYSSSGQFGKDYLSYLLAQPELGQKYTILWSKSFDIEDLREQSRNAYIEQLGNLPKSEMPEAIEKTLATINKGLKSNASYSPDISSITIDSAYISRRQTELKSKLTGVGAKEVNTELMKMMTNIHNSENILGVQNEFICSIDKIDDIIRKLAEVEERNSA